MVDNFGIFPREFVEWQFYFIQILDRNRSASNNKTRCVKSYFIESQDTLDKKKDEMIAIANATNSRIYIHPSRRDKNQIALELLSLVADCIRTNTNNKIWRAYESTCGRNSWVEKIWVVDVDTKDDVSLQDTIKHIELIRPNRKPRKVIPTVKWYHLLYQWWFDLSKYTAKRDVHKNNPTLLYAN